MRDRLTYILALAMTLMLGTPLKASPAPAAPETFTWLAELVSVDTTARTMTVKARVAYQEALSELKQFKGGDPVWVVWSGVNDSSDAVWHFRRPETRLEAGEKLVTRAELVAPEAENQYVRLRVKVPEAVMTAMKSVKTGEWVRVTSPQRPSSEVAEVVGVRPFNDIPAAATARTD